MLGEEFIMEKISYQAVILEIITIEDQITLESQLYDYF